MDVLTNAPVVTVTLGGKPRQLLFGFRCWKQIGVNPFDSASRAAYFGELDVEKAAFFIVAAMENWAAYARLTGETPTADLLTVDEVIDSLDLRTFGDIVAKLKAASGDAQDSAVPAETGEESAADPRAA